MAQALAERRADLQGLAGSGSREADRRRMQEHPREPERAQRVVPFPIAVLVITGHRVSRVRRMHTNLVGPSGIELDIDE